ncbi:hypothetical protein GC163_13225 [bacterium]|nr:hypothetical protein [bacterium]
MPEELSDYHKPASPIAEGNYSIHEIRQITGKTVKKVEYGNRKSISGVHESELILLHFTDGTSLSLMTGSNAKNILDKPESLHVDFMLQWVKPKE